MAVESWSPKGLTFKAYMISKFSYDEKVNSCR